MHRSMTLPASDGRVLGVHVSGDPHGSPVFLLHGTPGSRMGPHPRAPVIHRLGVRLITMDRPGYGLSERRSGRRVADVAEDVAAVADGLGLERFAVVGRSGGAPHALACAALLEERVSKAAVLAPIAPPDAQGLNWFQGMARSNIIEYSSAAFGLPIVTRLLTAIAEQIRRDPTHLVPTIMHELPVPDQHMIADFGVRLRLATNFAEAVRRCGADGWVDDTLAFTRPWGFGPESVTAPTLVWHGEADVFSPVEHARWLGGRLPNAHLVIKQGAAHFDTIRVLPDALAWLVRKVAAPGPG